MGGIPHKRVLSEKARPTTDDYNRDGVVRAVARVYTALTNGSRDDWRRWFACLMADRCHAGVSIGSFRCPVQ